MYGEEIHFGKLLFKQSETVLTHLTPVTVTFDPKEGSSATQDGCVDKVWGR